MHGGGERESGIAGREGITTFLLLKFSYFAIKYEFYFTRVYALFEKFTSPSSPLPL